MLKLKESPDWEEFDEMLAELATISDNQLRYMGDSQKFCFWINLFNTFMLHIWTGRTASPKSTLTRFGIWKKYFYQVGYGSFDPLAPTSST